jgi:hypothetical protein
MFPTLPITLTHTTNPNNLNMFSEFFFWMYSYLRRIKTNDTPALNGYILICLFQFFNLGTIWVMTNYFLRINFEKNIAVYIGLSTIFILYIFNYFQLYAKREVIFIKYEALNQKRKIKGQIYFWIYILLSLILLFLSAANLVKLKQ